MASRSRIKQSKDVAIAVAVDKNKGSLHAFKWTVQKFLSKGQSLTLLHVRIFQASKSSSGSKNDMYEDDKREDLFLPFRCFCIQRDIEVEEIIVDGVDVAQEITQYVQDNGIGILVLGAPSKGGLLKKFKTTDVPTTVTKTAPDFCTVYVISKEKISSLKTATSSPPASLLGSRRSSVRSDTSSIRGDRSLTLSKADEIDIKSRLKKRGATGAQDSFVSDVSNGSSGSDRSLSSFIDNNDMGSFPNSYAGSDSTYSQDSGTWSTKSMDDIGAEMRRLKLELKQTKCGYSTPYRGPPMANQKGIGRQGWKSEKEHQKPIGRSGSEEMIQTDHRYRKYTIEEIQIATDNFSNSKKIGEGGYGPVYRSTLNHTAVAIKVLRPDAVQGKLQFQKEIEVLTTMRHPNMVLLLGACPEFGCLVYEYMSNGSLEDCLFRRDNSPTLPWQLRFRIAAEIATGLLFLHQTKPEPLVHRDLKPGNILLDRNFVSKIADVGLARLIPATSIANSVSNYHMTAAAGTFCYIDPEYQQTGMLGTKSDVYSFGVMLLQMITAKPPMGLTHLVERAIENGTFSSVLDPAVRDWPVEAAETFAKLALGCVELRRKDRPDLRTVVLPTLQKLSDLGEQNMSDFVNGATADSSNDSQASSVSLQEMPSNSSFDSYASRASYGEETA